MRDGVPGADPHRGRRSPGRRQQDPRWHGCSNRVRRRRRLAHAARLSFTVAPRRHERFWPPMRPGGDGDPARRRREAHRRRSSVELPAATKCCTWCSTVSSWSPRTRLRRWRGAIVEFAYPPTRRSPATLPPSSRCTRPARRWAGAATRNTGLRRSLPDALLLNGGVFRAEAFAERLQQVLESWRGKPCGASTTPIRCRGWRVAR